jgi:hypothetical protein
MPVVFPQLVQPSRLQQGHSDIRILAEARGEQASGRTSPDYYVIKFLSRVHDGSRISSSGYGLMSMPRDRVTTVINSGQSPH